MSTALPDRDDILNALRSAAQTLGHVPSRKEFLSASGMSEYHVLRHFLSWNEAVQAAGFAPYLKNRPINPDALIEDWGKIVRKLRRIPTRIQFKRYGAFSPSVFEKRIGPWSVLPAKFREFAADKPEWADVVALLPLENVRPPVMSSMSPPGHTKSVTLNRQHSKLDDRPTYGNPIDFRGLRHEPVNEQGVVFLFGMVARELGYHVEAVQTGYPDCEAKRQVDADKWQRVRIEFEFESRNFRDHGHHPDGCDIIVCWRHNWPECPSNLEVVELATVIQTLSASEE
ncbi:MAG: hypothetical protein M0Z59_07110 [Nitrospiraceae bacterium]|nr:hypothetical protein [Nitrospiraceae bacterium]